MIGGVFHLDFSEYEVNIDQLPYQQNITIIDSDFYHNSANQAGYVLIRGLGNLAFGSDLEIDLKSLIQLAGFIA